MPWLKETRRAYPAPDGLTHLTEIMEFTTVRGLPRFSRRYCCDARRIVGSGDFLDETDAEKFAGLGDVGPVTCFACLQRG